MNTEIDPAQLLTQLANEQSTGCLEIVYGSIGWNIFLRFGQLLSVDCSIQSLSQLVDRLRSLGYEQAAQSVKIDSPSDLQSSTDNLVRQEIDRLALEGLLNEEQLDRISTELSKEALESLLWLKNEQMTWHRDRLGSIDQGLNSRSNLDLSSTIEHYQQRLKIWQKFTTIIRSPHQRPYLTNPKFLETPIPGGNLSPKALSQIAKLMRGMSLRELALFLKQDELKLVKLLTPYRTHLRSSVLSVFYSEGTSE